MLILRRLRIGGYYRNEICIGLVGGLGPETTAQFYLKLVKKVRKMYKRYPSIIIDSIPFSTNLEKDIIVKSKNEKKLLTILIKSIKRLNNAKCSFIVIPCNTAHILLEKLKKISKVPIISIVDETVEYIKNHKYRKVGLLSTTKTVESKIYETSLKRNNIDLILPSKKEQVKVSKIITKILENKTSKNDKIVLHKIIENMIKGGSKAIVLGCTDLQLLLKGNRMKVELIDTFNVLLDSIFQIYKNKTRESYLLDKRC